MGASTDAIRGVLLTQLLAQSYRPDAIHDTTLPTQHFSHLFKSAEAAKRLSPPDLRRRTGAGWAIVERDCNIGTAPQAQGLNQRDIDVLHPVGVDYLHHGEKKRISEPNRGRARDTGYAYPGHIAVGASSWIRNSTGIAHAERRDAASRNWLTLPSVTSARASRADSLGVEADGEQPARTLLPNRSRRQKAIGGRDVPMDPDSRGDERDS